jgi:manganese/iron transport system ATP-binding protein
MIERAEPGTYRGAVHHPDTPTLELCDVSVTYGEQRALDDVSFQVEQGEQVAVVGPNGAGKSTLFKLVAGTLKPNRGRVLMCGDEPGRHTCIAYVPQRSQIDWTFPVTVEDVVLMGRVGRMGLFRRARRGDWASVRASLARVDATHLAQKQIGALSGGQQQRVFIARALAQEASMLLLDEPLSGLDAPSQQAIFQILTSLRPDGVTVMVATHDLNLAAARFDRVMLLNKRIVAFDRGPAVLTADNLLAAYGGHLHRVGEDAGMLLADSCCGGDDHAPVQPHCS